ncbi:T9SS type A sorting domain-containing protein [Patiriisocius marinus]|uniref:Secretion system C-terminal sorting domain-containing protein n=1 Tax=Patiriisocius marinus TaxID=1397112 RepID=A0A5J4J2I2_9FLAO|nr:T9SS type A sorting domain-containing protein [Patiriisocius marinus]GER59991.1 hypothetical protein ULMA_20990 [Patiriisocius marinus]
MKKIYILALVAFGFASTSNAQLLEDNMEDYLVDGNISTQSPYWRNWGADNSVDGEAANVSDEFASSGDLSMEVEEGVDQILEFTSGVTSGAATLKFNMYIPTGQSGYFNLQGAIPDAGVALTGSFLTSDIYFNEANGTPGEGSDGANTWNFPHDEWFEVGFVVDVDNQTFKMVVAGVEAIPTSPFNDASITEFGGADFYGGDGTILYYIDDVLLEEGDTLGAEDFNADVFTVYPNPVVDVLNISTRTAVDSVVVYDILGKVVLSANPGVASPSVDMSSLTSGAYLVNVTIGDASKTIKVIK